MAKTAEERREYQREAQRRWRAAHPEYKARVRQARKEKIENMTPDELAAFRKSESARAHRNYEKDKEKSYLRTAEYFAKMVGCVVVPDPGDSSQKARRFNIASETDRATIV